jgi:hypothetical protein
MTEDERKAVIAQIKGALTFPDEIATISRPSSQTRP